jgi:anti-sigma B factor antagonist
MPLELSVRKTGETAVVSIRGRVVFGEECNLVREQIKELIPQSSAVVLNLSGVEYVDSGGIGTLVALFTSARNLGVEFKLACGNERVMHVLKITKLIPILGMYADEASAIDACGKHATAS